jgi:hypothetical protein
MAPSIARHLLSGFVIVSRRPFLETRVDRCQQAERGPVEVRPTAGHHSDQPIMLGFNWSSQRLCALPGVPGRVPRQVFASQASCAACR